MAHGLAVLAGTQSVNPYEPPSNADACLTRDRSPSMSASNEFIRLLANIVLRTQSEFAHVD